MADRLGPTTGKERNEEFDNDYDIECRCEFIDLRFLAVTALDSDQAALNYFYQSPFYLKYRENALNERMRAGHHVDSHQVGLIFQVTYSNLDTIGARLKTFPPLDNIARGQIYSNGAIFHITLFSRTLGQSGVTTTPIKIYYIIQGSIFMCPPFGTLIRLRLQQSIEQFERFYDKLNGISMWSVTNGYSWEPKLKHLSGEIERLCQRFNFSESSEAAFRKDGHMNIFYLKPHESPAPRIAYDDARALATQLEEARQKAVSTIAK